MSERLAHRVTVFVDADNTLWDTDSVFVKAHLNLLRHIEDAMSLSAGQTDRLAFVRAVDQGIAERHHAGLRYPARLLIRGIALALTGVMRDRAARAAWLGNTPPLLAAVVEAQIESSFYADLAGSPELRSGVAEGLAALRAMRCMILVITEGALKKTEALGAKLELSGHFDRVIEGRKRPELYKRIVQLTGTSNLSFMIGDQLDRDIVPAKEAGLETIYFPGNFTPRWQLDEDAVRPDHHISSFAEVPPIVETRIAETQTRVGIGYG